MIKTLPMRIWIFSSTWPDPRISASCVRMVSLCNTAHSILPQISHSKVSINFVSSASLPADIEEIANTVGFNPIYCPINDRNAFQSAFTPHVLENETCRDIAIFDSFVAEEKYSWQFASLFPTALRVLDTQDLHFLRRSRNRQLACRDKQSTFSLRTICDFPNFSDSVNSKDVIRELSSIHRSDVSSVVSTVEKSLLESTFCISPEKLLLSSFFYNDKTISQMRQSTLSMKARSNFVFLGNFNHEGNRDCIQYMRKTIWPLMRKELPQGVQLHIYGANCYHHGLSAPQEGFIVKGFHPGEAADLLKKYRVLLTPLRFGAGIKGKICDSWLGGTPVSTTTIGSEGMESQLPFWGGLISQSEESLVASSCKLYTCSKTWNQCSAAGFDILEERFSFEKNGTLLWNRLFHLSQSRKESRKTDWSFQLLNWNYHRSLEFMSRYIEIKEKDRQ